jgi:hypothetical protein
VQTLDRDRHRRAQFLREQRNAQFLEQPAEFREPRIDDAAALRHRALVLLDERLQLGELLRVARRVRRSLSIRSAMPFR